MIGFRSIFDNAPTALTGQPHTRMIAVCFDQVIVD
jgi:hypothetical protein